MATSVQAAFAVTYPDAVRAVLAAFELFSLNLFEFDVPFDRLGLGSFHQRLLFVLFPPFYVAALSMPAAAARLVAASRGVASGDATRPSLRRRLLAALPITLCVLFVVFPFVSATAAQAFDCEALDTGDTGSVPSTRCVALPTTPPRTSMN